MGPMVYAGFIWPENFEQAPSVAETNLNDSKKLTEKDRDDLLVIFEKLKSEGEVDFETISISPEVISHHMLSEEKKSLNLLSEEAAYQLVRKFLAKGFNLATVIIDTVGDENIYHSRISKEFSQTKLKFIVEPRADGTHKVVSAASVVAKVSRDRALRNWVFEEHIDGKDRYWNVGYPDEECNRWLVRNCHRVMGMPSLVRYSWKNAEDVINENMPKMKWSPYEHMVDDEDTLIQLRKTKNQFSLPKELLCQKLRQELMISDEIDLF